MRLKAIFIIIYFISLLTHAQDSISIFSKTAKTLQFGAVNFENKNETKSTILLTYEYGGTKVEVNKIDFSENNTKIKYIGNYNLIKPMRFSYHNGNFAILLSSKWEESLIIRQKLIYHSEKDSNGKFKIRTLHLGNINAFKKELKSFFNKNIKNKKMKLKGSVFDLTYDKEYFYLKDKQGKIGAIEYGLQNGRFLKYKRAFLPTNLSNLNFKTIYCSIQDSKSYVIKDKFGKEIASITKKSYKSPGFVLSTKQEVNVNLRDKNYLDNKKDYASLALKLQQMGFNDKAKLYFDIASTINPMDPQLNYYSAILNPKFSEISNNVRAKSVDEKIFLKSKNEKNIEYEYIDSEFEKITNHIDIALKTDNNMRKDSLIELQSQLLFNNRIIDRFEDLHIKYGYSDIENFRNTQFRRTAIINIISNNLDKAQNYFSKDLESYNNLFYLGVIAYLKGNKRMALDYFQSSYDKNDEITKTLYNLIMTKISIDDKSYCKDLEKLKSRWSDTAYNLLYNNCGYYEYELVPIYREERYDAGGYTDSRGRYQPDYQIRKIKTGESKEKIYPKKISFPETKIFITHD
ncbi:MAG: hypothetical protein JXR05_15285 [Flavobacteriaceae bacterium]